MQSENDSQYSWKYPFEKNKSYLKQLIRPKQKYFDVLKSGASAGWLRRFLYYNLVMCYSRDVQHK